MCAPLPVPPQKILFPGFLFKFEVAAPRSLLGSILGFSLPVGLS